VKVVLMSLTPEAGDEDQGELFGILSRMKTSFHNSISNQERESRRDKLFNLKTPGLSLMTFFTLFTSPKRKEALLASALAK
jgi:hypothetical protein